jgi:signal transduction histidine kinase/phage shock protein PspC (stress-responsive transcriptional regulator)
MPVTARAARARFTRPESGRMLAGVAAGIGDGLGVDTNVVRVGFVALSVAFGLGVVCYAIAWIVMPPRAPNAPAPPARERPDPVANVAFGGVVLGGLLLARALGLWPGDLVVWPLVIVLVGLALLAMRGGTSGDASELSQWPGLDRLPPDAAAAVAALVGTRRGALARAVAGIVCIAVGVIALIASVDSWRALQGATAAILALLLGIALVVGPGISRLVHELVGERRERIRADERAEVAAHLHDSVLQTLALVQRRADDPREVTRLARAQERELRAWLVGGGAPGRAEAGSLARGLDDIAADVEREHGVPVDVVRVGDCDAEGLEPLLAAAREAIVNAAVHSGAAIVNVYVEVEAGEVTVFVRDRGRGFDPASVAGDRGGLRNSIEGRMLRAGGRAAVRSAPGEGTEVELVAVRER